MFHIDKIGTISVLTLGDLILSLLFSVALCFQQCIQSR